MKSSVLALFAAAAFSMGSMSLVMAQDAPAVSADAAITGCPIDTAAGVADTETGTATTESLSDADATGEDDGSSTSDTADASNCCPTVAADAAAPAADAAAAVECPVGTEEETASESN